MQNLGGFAGADVHDLGSVHPIGTAVGQQHGIGQRRVDLILQEVEEGVGEQTQARKAFGVLSNEERPLLPHALVGRPRYNTFGVEVSCLPDGIDDRLFDHLLDDQPTVSVERLEHVGHRGGSREAT